MTQQAGHTWFLIAYDYEWNAIAALSTAAAAIIALGLPFLLEWRQNRTRRDFALELLREVGSTIVSKSMTDSNHPNVIITDEYSAMQMRLHIARLTRADELVTDAIGLLSASSFPIFVNLRKLHRLLIECITRAEDALHQNVDAEADSPGLPRMRVIGTNENTMRIVLMRVRDDLKPKARRRSMRR